MDRFLIKAAFGSEAFIRGCRGAYLRVDAYKKKCGKAEDVSVYLVKTKISYVNVAYKGFS